MDLENVCKVCCKIALQIAFKIPIEERFEETKEQTVDMLCVSFSMEIHTAELNFVAFWLDLFFFVDLIEFL